MRPLRFGIPSLDGLIDSRPRQEGDTKPRGIPTKANESTSVSIIGPDGTGKSILGLHLASYYLSDHAESEETPVVLYVSTDLSYKMAHDRTWVPFALDRPRSRAVPFSDSAGGAPGVEEPIGLWQLNPIGTGVASSDINDVSGFLTRSSEGRKRALAVGFIDLAANSAGDDWGFVNRVLALLPSTGTDSPAHLMILDSVDGFETLVGDLDAYGLIHSRRARIAQIMRSANKKCHLVFVSEEPVDERRIPEQFVTDLVIRLRKKHLEDYIRRTIELEKARGLEHVRGMHHYVIRSGRGSTTGEVENLDDPRVPRRDNQDVQAYFHVYSSLHRYARATMQRIGPKRPEVPAGKFAAFGLRYLDNMLGGRINEEAVINEGFESCGLPCATVTALIGDALTQKTRLGRAFLSRCFAQYAERLIALAGAMEDCPEATAAYLMSLLGTLQDAPVYNTRWKTDSATRLFDAAAILKRYDLDQLSGTAVLFATHDIDSATLVTEFSRWFLRDYASRGHDESFRRQFRELLAAYCAQRTICRRLEIHDMSPSILMHIVQRTVWEAQRKVMGDPPEVVDDRYSRSHGIRVVIDDLSTVLATYPEVRDDPLFLPALLFHLRREGVTTLIIDTHSGQPGILQADSSDSQLRALVDQRLYTWRVPFYGENRVAIAAIPPFTEATAIIREVRTEVENQDPFVDPEFELYTGLEERNPQPVPLEVQVHEETPAFRAYMETENLFYRNLFAPNRTRKETNSDVIVCRPNREYEGLREFCYLNNNVWLDYTLVFEVDEYWAVLKSNALADVGPYLRETTSENGVCRKESDPFALFQPTSDCDHGSKLARHQCFPRYFSEGSPLAVGRIDRVPFCWDFGFLVCRKRLWELAAEQELADQRRSPVQDVWSRLRKIDLEDNSQRLTKINEGAQKPVTWMEFLSACSRVAQAERARTGNEVPSFDLSMLSPESFSCLVLEIWSSGIVDGGVALPFGPDRQWDGTRGTVGLIELILGDDSEWGLFERQWADWKEGKAGLSGHWIELYKTWLMLGEVLDISKLAASSNVFEFAQREATLSAIAARHWYKTASAQTDQYSATDPSIAVQLPGRYSVRGDWFLAIARNSRSKRLAYRAIDIRCSRRANVSRLKLGVGLPVRDVEPMEIDHSLKDILRSEMYEGPRTCLYKPGAQRERHTITFADMTYIGADSNGSPISWLWRSNLKDYDRHSRIFQQWLCRMMNRLNQLKEGIGPGKSDGFQVVNALSKAQKGGDFRSFLNAKDSNREFKWRSMTDFIERLKFLITDLKQASPLGD